MTEAPSLKTEVPTLSEQDRTEIMGRILTHEQEAGLDFDGSPFSYRLEAGDRILTYFGAEHSRDPNNPQFVPLERIFHDAKPSLVIIEGMRVRYKEHFEQHVLALTREQVIQEMGESGFTVWLALKEGIAWHCPEPDPIDHIQHLETTGFSRDHLLAHEIMHVLPQYHRQTKAKTGFKDYVTKGFIKYLQERTQWPNFDYSYERGLKVAEAIVGHSIDVERCSYNDAIGFITPIPSPDKLPTWTVLNEISKTSSTYRDQAIVLDILEKLRHHPRVFAVYGSSHPIRQKPALAYGMERLFDTATPPT